MIKNLSYWKNIISFHLMFDPKNHSFKGTWKDLSFMKNTWTRDSSYMCEPTHQLGSL
jgi:hypothetical protein